MEEREGEDMEARHTREKKELQEKVEELKKSIMKADKKKKKEVNSEIARLEGDLNEKHSAELMEQMLDGVTIEEENEEKDVQEEEKVETKQSNGGQRVSKAQKRRDKKAEKEVMAQNILIPKYAIVCYAIYLPLCNSKRIGKAKRRN